MSPHHAGRLRLGLAAMLNLGSYFAFQITVIQALGPGAASDAFVASNTIPQLVIAVLGGSLGFVLVPVLAVGAAERRRHDVWLFVYAVGILSCSLAVLLLLSRRAWVPWLVPGFDAEQQALTSHLAAIQLLAMPVSAVVAVQLAGQAARQRFALAEAAQAAANLCALALAIYLVPRHGVVAAAWIALLRVVLQSAGLGRGLAAPCRVHGVREVLAVPLARLRPLLLGAAYYRTEPTIDRHLLSNAPSGALTHYFVVEQIFAGIGQLLNKTLVAPAVPTLSRMFEGAAYAEFWALYIQTILRVLIPSSLAWMVLVAFAALLLPDLATAIGGAEGAWSALWWLALALGGTLVGGAGGQIAAAGFYACGDTVTIMRMSLINYTVYIPFKVLAFECWGVTGLAACASIYAMNNFIMQVVLMRRKLRRLAPLPA